MVEIDTTRFAIESSLSLLRDSPNNASIRWRPVLNELASTSPREPLNREIDFQSDLLSKFLGIIDKRGIKPLAKDRSPYWMGQGTSYDKMEVFGTCVQFIDQHSAPLPKTTLPPSQDIQRFINHVLQEPETVTIDRQFEILLDITNNDVVGAANVGMLATRYMSRFSDIRAYPNLTINGKLITPSTSDSEIEPLMRAWNEKIARFETYNDKNGRIDGTGDQYYFWTHFFAASVFDNYTPVGRTFQAAFNKGNAIMIFAKDKIAKRGGTVSNHYEASLLGRHIGLALGSL